MRIGPPCHVLGMPDPKMRAAQLGRFQRGLVDLRPIYAYNADYAVRAIRACAAYGLMAFRLSTDIFPLLDVDVKLRRFVPSLEPLAAAIRETGMHVSNHPGQFALLSTANPKMLTNALGVLRDAGWVMDQAGADGSITIHGGGTYDDRASAAARVRENLREVAPEARRLLVFENDEHSWTVPELLAIDAGLPIVFDKLHWQANLRSAPYATELEGALATWPANRIPELHYSEQAEGKVRGAHADWITGRGLLEFMEEVDAAAKGRDVSIIVEAKKKDLAIARAVGELTGARRRRFFQLVPELARAPKDWPKLAA